MKILNIYKVSFMYVGHLLYPLQTMFVRGGYTVFTSICPSVRDVFVFLLHLEKAMIEIHQILQTH